jgi:DNA invertase Pin-like site-specific DNA recombinase
MVAEYFDIGQSRSVPWDRREQGSRLLAALKDRNRGWDAVVVGEGTRCWFGNQFSLIAPRFAPYGVDLWVPELGGKYDALNPSRKMLMSVPGGMSESERQHVQARVRAAMDAQVVNEGRHQGGRTPYGYLVVDGGPHPNPRKAAEGYRLRILVIEEETAEVVRRIFAEYLDEKGDRVIAHGLNLDGIPCPSARWPDQNPHRLADGWQGSTVWAILQNPRYTGYAVFGRCSKHEVLLDPDDVAAGHVTRFRKSSPERVVWSRRPAHPAIVSVETFTQAQLLRRSRAAGGMHGRAQLERTRQSGTRPYLFRGRIRCAICTRKMQGGKIRQDSYYRCLARTLAPGSATLAEPPRTVNLRESVVLGPLNDWLGELFARENRDRLVAGLLEAQPKVEGNRETAKRRLADAEAKLWRFRAAIEAGIDPAALVEATNKAHAQRVAAQAELDNVPAPGTLTDADLYAMIDSLGDVGAALTEQKPVALGRLYESVRLEMIHQPDGQEITVAISPRVVSECVRGPTLSTQNPTAPTAKLRVHPKTLAIYTKPCLARKYGPRMRTAYSPANDGCVH